MDNIKFNTVKSMVSWLIDNEGKVLADDYGREWKYINFKFFFKDIGGIRDRCFEPDKLTCLHLYDTKFKILKTSYENN